MRITPSTPTRQRGIVLVVTLCTVLILAIIITSYLTLSNQVGNSVARSQSWNQAIPVLESGIEEGLTQLHYAGTNSYLLVLNNWTYGLDGGYHKSRSFSDGTYFNACIMPASNPIIYSTGYVAVMKNSGTVTNYVSRRVKVVTAKQPNTPGGLNAKGQITLAGGTIVDSYDSSNPNYSSNGMYVASKHKDNGLVLTDSSGPGIINIATGTVFGSVATGPTGTVITGGTGVVGDSAYVAGSTGIENGHDSNNANVQFNDVTAPYPFNKGITPLSGTVFGTNYAAYLSTGSYSMTSINLNGSQGIAIIGNATLYVNGSVNMTAQSFIYIAPGASLTMYVNGSVSVGGGGIINADALPSQCTIYGMPGCTSIKYSGGTGLIGTIYAPEANVTYSGSASMCGAISANTIKFTGGASLHYDEALVNNASDYVVISWNEF